MKSKNIPETYPEVLRRTVWGRPICDTEGCLDPVCAIGGSIFCYDCHMTKIVSRSEEACDRSWELNR